MSMKPMIPILVQYFYGDDLALLAFQDYLKETTDLDELRINIILKETDYQRMVTRNKIETQRSIDFAYGYHFISDTDVVNPVSKSFMDNLMSQFCIPKKLFIGRTF